MAQLRTDRVGAQLCAFCGSLTPMALREILAELSARSCDQKQIGDALAEADPTWQEQLGAR